MGLKLSFIGLLFLLSLSSRAFTNKLRGFEVFVDSLADKDSEEEKYNIFMRNYYPRFFLFDGKELEGLYKEYSKKKKVKEFFHGLAKYSQGRARYNLFYRAFADAGDYEVGHFFQKIASNKFKLPKLKERFQYAESTCLDYNWLRKTVLNEIKVYETIPEEYDQSFLNIHPYRINAIKEIIGRFQEGVVKSFSKTHNGVENLANITYKKIRGSSIREGRDLLESLITKMKNFSVIHGMGILPRVTLIKCVVPKLIIDNNLSPRGYFLGGGKRLLNNFFKSDYDILSGGYGQCLDFSKISILIVRKMGIEVRLRSSGIHHFTEYRLNGQWYISEPLRPDGKFFIPKREKK